MKGVNANEFIDHMSYGDELVFIFNERKRFCKVG